MKNNLHQIAERLVEDGKGILAADESTATITKRFSQINLQSTPENRRSYRECSFELKMQWKATYLESFYMMKQSVKIVKVARR